MQQSETYVTCTTASYKIQKHEYRCSRHDGVRAGRGSPCAILPLHFSMAASSLWLTRPVPSHVLSLTLNSSRFSFPPVSKTKTLLAACGACGADVKINHFRSGRVRFVFSLPVDAQAPSSFCVQSSLLTAQFFPRKPRLRRSLARGVTCLRARASRLRIAAPPLLPKSMRES